MRKKRHDDAKFQPSVGAACLFDACINPARLSGWIAHGAAGQRAAGQGGEIVRTGKAGGKRPLERLSGLSKQYAQGRGRYKPRQSDDGGRIGRPPRAGGCACRNCGAACQC